MGAHRFARRPALAAADRGEDRGVAAHRRRPVVAQAHALRQQREHRRVLLLPQTLDHRDQRRVAARSRDRRVEAEIGAAPFAPRGVLGDHLVVLRRHRGEVERGRARRGERRRLAFDQHARAEDFARAVAGVDRRRGRERLVADERAGAGAHFEQSADLQRDHRLAHHRPAHPQALGEVALGRQPLAGRELAGADQGADLVGDLFVEPSAVDGLEWHRRFRFTPRDKSAGARRSQSPPRRASQLVGRFRQAIGEIVRDFERFVGSSRPSATSRARKAQSTRRLMSWRAGIDRKARVSSLKPTVL